MGRNDGVIAIGWSARRINTERTTGTGSLETGSPSVSAVKEEVAIMPGEWVLPGCYGGWKRRGTVGDGDSCSTPQKGSEKEQLEILHEAASFRVPSHLQQAASLACVDNAWP